MSFLLFSYLRVIFKKQLLKEMFKAMSARTFYFRSTKNCIYVSCHEQFPKTGFIELILTPNSFINQVFFKFSVLQKEECKQTGIKITRSFWFYNLTGSCFYLYIVRNQLKTDCPEDIHDGVVLAHVYHILICRRFHTTTMDLMMLKKFSNFSLLN